jgi:hypothetical protein
LVLRPDDVWLSILTQFNFYVNTNAESARSIFVAYKDKKELEVDIRPFSLRDVDMGKIAQCFTLLIQENVLDPK